MHHSKVTHGRPPLTSQKEAGRVDDQQMHWNPAMVMKAKPRSSHAMYYAHIEENPWKTAYDRVRANSGKLQRTLLQYQMWAGRSPGDIATFTGASLKKEGVKINRHNNTANYQLQFLLLKSWPRNKPLSPPQTVERWLCSALQGSKNLFRK